MICFTFYLNINPYPTLKCSTECLEKKEKKKP